VDAHWHDSCEVLYVRRGWGTQRINAETMPFHPGDVVLIRSGDVHATEAISAGGSDIDCVRFFAEKLQAGNRVERELPSGIIRPENEDMQNLFDAMDRCDKDRMPEKDVILSGLIQILIGLLLRSGEKNGTVRSAAMGKICAYMEIAQNLSLESVSAQFGYCPEHLSRRFHAETGKTYRQYCEQIRMRRAVARLRDEVDISVVAEAVGYSDSSSFIRAFRRMYGITPSAYRKSGLSIESEASI